MSKPERPSPGLGAIAKAAGVTRAAVSYALRNKPGVSEETRERICRIAAEMGYAPDARIHSWMAAVRESKSRDLLPIAWLNFHSTERHIWREVPYLTPYLEGARLRAQELGYRLEEIWASEPGMTQQKLSRMLYQRGIEGVVITKYIDHLRLAWENFAAVSMEQFLVAPALPRVATDLDYNICLAVTTLRKLKYRRIGICLEENILSITRLTPMAVIQHLNSQVPASQRVTPMIYLWNRGADHETPGKVGEWVTRERPEVVICHTSQMLAWLRDSLGMRIPEDIGVVHLATDDDVTSWAGINSNRRDVGAAAVDWVVSRILKRDLGIPRLAAHMTIRGEWHSGVTLRA